MAALFLLRQVQGLATIAIEIAKEYGNKVAVPTEDMISGGCFGCCKSKEMRMLEGSAEYFFDAVNSESCCCFKDGSLSKAAPPASDAQLGRPPCRPKRPMAQWRTLSSAWCLPLLRRRRRR